MGMIERKKSILLNEPHLATASGSVATFDTDLRSKLKECKINFLPVQSGSGDPSPSNIRPISGRTGLTVTRCGKNLLNPNDPDCVSGHTILSNGTLTTAAVISVSPYIKMNAGVQLTYKSASIGTSGAGYNRRIVCFDKDKQYISAIAETTGNPNTDVVTSGTTPTGTAFVRVPFYTNYTITSGHQLEIGSQTTYEVYTANEIPVSWSSEGTIYGGYVDLATGELVATIVMNTYDGSSDEDWRVETLSSGKNFYIPYASISPTPIKNQLADNGIICNQAVTRISESTYQYVQGMWYISFSGAINVALGTPTNSSTVEEFRTYLSGHPLQITYKLATPIRYTLSPQTIKTLLGRNNIWSDSGDVTVKYWTH